jgi:hypothetical protein
MNAVEVGKTDDAVKAGLCSRQGRTGTKADKAPLKRMSNERDEGHLVADVGLIRPGDDMSRKGGAIE